MAGDRNDDANTAAPRYWFPTKTYGWGWGPPVTWEGWVVLGEYLTLLSVAAWWSPPHVSIPGFIAGVTLPTLVMIGICFWKGEPPRWRWGD
jgi:hypothetical protein